MDGVNPMYGAPVPSILLIDDDNRLASMVADYLRDHQFEVSHAATGAAALAAIKRQSFDLILLDLMLPDTDGLTLFRDLTAHLRATPIIMLTARGDPMDKVVELKIGAEDYVAKPFEPRELLARIRVVLRRGAVTPSDSLRFGRLEIDRSSRIVRIGDEEKPLTSYQFDLLNAMAERVTIFIPESEAELRRFFEGELEGWRVFLHPEQRKIAYRDYKGPALVRGGAGTGKTVVAMHRAKYLADRIASDRLRAGQRVLLTTFTTSLAQDIEANLKTLCPEHLTSSPPRIEVINLDRWVSQFLKRKNFGRSVAYFGEEQRRLDDLWNDVFLNHDLPEGLSEAFVKAEWTQIVQAKGLMDRREYLTVSRAGRGTPLDRRKRAALWDIFADYRARMISEGLAEPDDAYREATEILGAETPNLPYSAVIVDEAQDMGAQAFRLIRAIVPEATSGNRNAIFIVGDAHQRIYARKAIMASCGINIRGRSYRLKLNYRTTHEIRAWAVSILEGVTVDDLDEGKDTLQGYVSLFHGPSPELAHSKSEAEELKGTRRVGSAHGRERHPALGYRYSL